MRTIRRDGDDEIFEAAGTVESDAEHRAHEEAIVPVRPGLAAAGAPGDVRPARRLREGPVLAVAALVLLVVVAGFVFVVLPRWVARPPEPAAEAPLAKSPAPAVPEAPALTEEQIAALTEQADALLAELLTQQQRLGELSASSWGGESWQRYQALGRAGDDAYLAKALPDAVDAYRDALALGEELLARSAEITQRALEAGQRAIEAGNPQLAIQQFDLVLRIEPDHEAAKAGRARAERLPEVLALVQRADGLRRGGRLEEAAKAYREALAIDAEWAPARSGLEDAERRIADARFEAIMSAGMQALADERYEDAEREFRAALAMRPNAAGARDGLMQAEQGRKLDEIALAEARALAFERREMWAQAIAQYEAALAEDPTLAFAKTGLERAQARADLEAKLVNLIENPSLLFRDDVLAGAKALVEEAVAVASKGENPRLTGQAERLGELVTLASTPVPVRLVSDELTEVTVYRVGPLGTFASKEIELRPGNYTVIGSRDGFRDVRKTFTVLPGRELEPISVICVEPI